VHVRMGSQNREKSLCVCIWGPSKISSHMLLGRHANHKGIPPARRCDCDGPKGNRGGGPVLSKVQESVSRYKRSTCPRMPPTRKSFRADPERNSPGYHF
jgi:hypothetical protein